MVRDHLKLQIIIVLWGFTAVLGELLSLPASGIVAWRTGIAASFLLIWLRNRCRTGWKNALMFLTTGLIIGGHWITFFLAVKIANVSICMIGVATLSLWTAILEPIIIKHRHFRPIDLVFGAIIVIGVAIIYRSELEYSNGFLVALLSAFLAAVFSIINSFHIEKEHHLVITFYEMLGASLLACAFLLFKDGSIPFPNGSEDWLWIIILAVFCTVVAYSQYVELLKRMNVFTLNFAGSLEPVYGIALAALFFQEHQTLNRGFYLGAMIIIGSICLYPIARRKFVKKPTR